MAIVEYRQDYTPQNRRKYWLRRTKEEVIRELMLEQDMNQQQGEAIKRLEAKLGRDPDEKLSPCCGETLIKFISQNRKVCYKCRKEFDWALDPGQKPLFQRSGD